MNAQPLPTEPAPGEPNVAGVRVRPAWSIALYVLLVSAAALALFAQRSPTVSPAIAAAAPWVFLSFVLGFTVYRVALVAARRYSPFKAFVQVFIAAIFFALLLAPKARVKGGGPEALLRDRDPRVRAVAAEVLGWRGAGEHARALVPLLEDADPEVRAAVRAALVKLNAGVDLGDSRAAWEARFP
jgi:hypothetical protein